MGRKRSNYICPKCGEQGRNPRLKKFKYRDYLYVEHYDPVKKKISKTCYIDNILSQNKLKEIYQDSSPVSKLIKYSLEIELKKLSKSLEIIAKRFEKSDVTPEDERMIAYLIRIGRMQLNVISMILVIVHKLRNKDNRTVKEEKLLKRAEISMRKFRLMFKQTHKIINLVSLLGFENIDDALPAERRIIRQNLPGFLEFSNLSINRAFSYWFDKYESPKREAKFKELKKRYSIGAFGSEKYSGTIGE